MFDITPTVIRQSGIHIIYLPQSSPTIHPSRYHGMEAQYIAGILNGIHRPLMDYP